MNRRTVITSIMALVALAVLAMPALAGGTSEAAGEGVDRVVVALSPPTSETLQLWTGRNYAMLDAAMDGLVGHDLETGEFAPTKLAESWEHNADMTVWTFKLREGVQFHYDWGEVTAEDVVHSWELHTVDDAVTSNLADLQQAKPVAVDKYTVRFELERPDPNFLFLHGGRTAMFIHSKAQYEAEGMSGYNEQLVGTGPYRFVEHTPGRILFERVENAEDHYGGRTPDFAELELRFVTEHATRLAMVRSGEAQIAQLPPQLYPAAEREGMELVEATTPTMDTNIVFNGLYLTSGDPDKREDLPWADVRIREAINRAIDREELLETLFPSGGARLRPVYGMNKGHEGYDPTLVERFEEEYGYDPDLAQELMAEAGYPDAFPDPTIPLIRSEVPGNPEMPLQQEIVQQYLNEVGFVTELVEFDHARIAEVGRAREAYFLNANRNGPVRPTQAALTAFFTTSGGPYQGYEDDTIERIVNELVSTLDAEERDEIAREAFNYLFEQYAVVPLFEIRSMVAVDPEFVAGWKFPGVTSNGIGYSWEWIESAE
jgi:peptide/nickel transport system substrate-binding protein